MSLWNTLQSWIQGAPGASPAVAPREGPPPDAEELTEALRLVVDPELGIDIVSMGLLRGIAVDGDRVEITMTLSTPGCPVGPMIIGEVEDTIRRYGMEPALNLVFDPPWTPDDIAPEARGRVR